MGRPELPIDQTVPQRAALAQWLRDRRTACGLTYGQMEGRCLVSAATLKRAAGGQRVPKLYVAKSYVFATRATKVPADDFGLSKAMDHVEYLWVRARYACQRVRYTTPGHYRLPDPRLVDDRADLSRALRELHAMSGAPSPYKMEGTAGGFGILPAATARRILEGRTLPGSAEQFMGFLGACGLDPISDSFNWWLVAFDRALQAEPPRAKEMTLYEEFRVKALEMKVMKAA